MKSIVVAIATLAISACCDPSAMRASDSDRVRVTHCAINGISSAVVEFAPQHAEEIGSLAVEYADNDAYASERFVATLRNRGACKVDVSGYRLRHFESALESLRQRRPDIVVVTVTQRRATSLPQVTCDEAN